MYHPGCPPSLDFFFNMFRIGRPPTESAEKRH